MWGFEEAINSFTAADDKRPHLRQLVCRVLFTWHSVVQVAAEILVASLGHHAWDEWIVVNRWRAPVVAVLRHLLQPHAYVYANKRVDVLCRSDMPVWVGRGIRRSRVWIGRGRLQHSIKVTLVKKSSPKSCIRKWIAGLFGGRISVGPQDPVKGWTSGGAKCYVFCQPSAKAASVWRTMLRSRPRPRPRHLAGTGLAIICIYMYICI